MYRAGVIEPKRVKKQAIQSAAEAAEMILRIDDVIASSGAGKEPDMREGADPERYESQDVLDPRTLYILNERSEKFREHTFERPNLPRRSVFGEKRVLVLLVDFKDQPAKTESHHFREMLFSKKSTNGSLREYYNEVSCGASSPW